MQCAVSFVSMMMVVITGATRNSSKEKAIAGQGMARPSGDCAGVVAALLFAVLAANALEVSSPPSRPPQAPPELDCKVRELAWTYARQLQPSQGDFLSVYDALELGPLCNISATVPPPPPPRRSRALLQRLLQARSRGYDSGDDGNTASLYVSPQSSSSGAEAIGFQTIAAAVEYARAHNLKASIVLEGGLHFLNETVLLHSEDSSLSLEAKEGELPTVSGGVPLENLTWSQFTQAEQKNIWVADVPKEIGVIESLYIYNGSQIMRATRARYPNCDPERQVPDARLSSTQDQWLPAKAPQTQSVNIELASPLRNDTPSGQFSTFRLGIGGGCETFDPPESYWCADSPSGGGAEKYSVPSGLTCGEDDLPNLPYRKVNGAILNAWREAHWANWMFEIDSYDNETRQFTFGRGGFQGARGASAGSDWFIENVFEELDSPNEFFHDVEAGKLYFFYNSSEFAQTGKLTPPPDDLTFVVGNLDSLIRVQASQDLPAVNISISGIRFTGTRYTYMDPHGVPSGGDWALERNAALFFEGVENLQISNCTFERLDGNAVMLSGYCNSTELVNNEFAWLGGSAMAAWGYTKLVDATEGNIPRYTKVLSNVAREVGIYAKQNSFWFQAKTANTLLKGNVFFNGPRAGINFNDGLGGGNEITDNILFNTCRESGDHGPFNSWDRQPFLAHIAEAGSSVDPGSQPSVYPAFNIIHHNLVIGNYQTQEAIDNDDGSAYYRTYSNVFFYGETGLKNDYDGHDNIHYDNLYAYVTSSCINLAAATQLPDHLDKFYNNTCILSEVNSKYGTLGDACDVPKEQLPYLEDNRLFTRNGTINICGKSLETWHQQTGLDQNTTVDALPDDNFVIGLARNILGI